MEPTGSDHPLIYILGEAPGKTEDQCDEQFIGDSGQFLRERLPRRWIEDLRFNNVVRDWPIGRDGKNRTPHPVEIECCRPSIIRDIEAAQPAAIFGFGGIPLHWATKRSSIMVARGSRFPVRIGTHVCWYYAFVHPSAVLRQGGGKTELGRVFDRDLRRAFEEMEIVREDAQHGNVPDCQYTPPSVPTKDEIGSAIHLEMGSPARIFRFLDEINQPDKIVGFDIETKGLRPYGEGKKILTFAFSTGDETMAFGLDHRGVSQNFLKELLRDKLRHFFAHPKCRLVAHNLTFEMEWLVHFFGEPVLKAATRYTCSMAQAYILNETKDGHSLDYLIQRYFGFGLKELSNVDIKRLDETPLPDVLLYNALDAKWTAKLFHAQRERLRAEQLEDAFEHHQTRVPTLVASQIRGLCVDQAKAEELNTELIDKMAQLTTDLRADPDVQGLREKGGSCVRALAHAKGGGPVLPGLSPVPRRVGRGED